MFIFASGYPEEMASNMDYQSRIQIKGNKVITTDMFGYKVMFLLPT